MPKGGKASRHEKRLKDTLSEAPLPPEEEEVAEKPDFSNLPEAVVVNVLLKSSMEDVLRLCCCCQTFRKAANTESFWKQYCHHNWGHKTCPSQWLQSRPVTHIPSLPRATDYKSLGMLLKQMDSLIGFWLGSVKRPRGLFEFMWMPDCVACCDLMSSSGGNVLYVGPHYSVAGEIVDGCHCILRDYRHSALPSGCLTTAAAVASVAVGSVSDPSLSTSFETEMMRYMQSTVQSKRNRAHRRCHGSGVLPDMHHFTRLSIPPATKHTWITGLWSRASLDENTQERICEVILVEYDFSGSKAQICCDVFHHKPSIS